MNMMNGPIVSKQYEEYAPAVHLLGNDTSGLCPKGISQITHLLLVTMPHSVAGITNMSQPISSCALLCGLRESGQEYQLVCRLKVVAENLISE